MDDQEYITALLEERRGYEQRMAVAKSQQEDDATKEYGEEMETQAKAGLAAVAAELKRIGHEAEPPAKRATTRKAEDKPTVSKPTAKATTRKK